MHARAMIWLVGVVLLTTCQSAADDITVSDIIAGAEKRRESLTNAEIEVSITHGRPETSETADFMRVSWMGDSGKQEILERKVTRRNQPVDRPTNRVTAVTPKFAYVIERQSASEEWRVSNTMLESQDPLSVSVRFNRITSWKELTTEVDGFRLKELLLRSSDIEILEADDTNLVTVEMSPPSDLGGFTIARMRLQFHSETFALASFQYVYIAEVPGQPKRFIRVEQTLDGTREWESGVYYPRTVRNASQEVAAPSLTEDVLSVNSVMKAEILSLKTGSVKADDFLPSAYGLPNHIVGLDTQSPQWSPWVLAIICLNVVAILGWFVFRRRQT